MKSSLPFVLIIAGIVELIVPSIIAVWLVPKLTGLYNSLENNAYNATLTYALFGIIIAICLAQIAYGIKIKTSQNKTQELSNHQRSIGIALLVIGGLFAVSVFPLSILTVILPIYNLTTSF